MNSKEVLEILEEAGAVRQGHFQLSSGLHAERYWQCALALEDPAITEKIGRAIAAEYDANHIDTIVSPAIGGLVLGFAVALAMGKRFIWAERASGRMIFRRGFSLKVGERVLVIEDVVTTGGSVAEVIGLIKSSRAEVAGVACLINRGGQEDIEGTKLKSLLKAVTEVYKPEDCPLCKAGKAIESPGSRRN
jgi:orotate phosphoribosyltransferase